LAVIPYAYLYGSDTAINSNIWILKLSSQIHFSGYKAVFISVCKDSIDFI